MGTGKYLQGPIIGRLRVLRGVGRQGCRRIRGVGQQGCREAATLLACSWVYGSNQLVAAVHDRHRGVCKNLQSLRCCLEGWVVTVQKLGAKGHRVAVPRD